MPENLVQSLTDALSTWGLKVVGAIAVLIIGSMVAKMVRRAVRKGLTARNVDATLVPFFASMVYYALSAFVFVAVLGLFGVEVASIIAMLGAAAFAVGLALQGTLSNFAAGVMLLLFRPFRVGEVVEISGMIGKVHEIGIFATHLNTGDNVRIIVPNGTVWGATIKNFATNDDRRVDMVVGVDYGDNLQTATDIIARVVAADPRVLQDPAVTIAVSELADSSVNFVVRPWCKKEDYWALKFDLTRKFKEELEAGGCSIPFPQQDVHMHQVAANS